MHMEVNEVADMEVFKVADMDVNMDFSFFIGGILGDFFKFTSEIF